MERRLRLRKRTRKRNKKRKRSLKSARCETNWETARKWRKKRAIEVVYADVFKWVLTLVRRKRLANPNDLTGDMVQTAVVSFMQMSKCLPLSHADTRNLLVCISYRRLLDHWKKQKNTRKVEREKATESTQAELFRIKTVSPIMAAMDSLNPEAQELLKLHYVDGKTVAEIALQFGVSKRTIDRKLKQARERLRSVFETGGVERR